MIHWAPEKEVTDYFKFVINVEIFILGLVPTEIERDGKKEKTNEGNLRMKIRAEVVKDYEERWEKKPMSKFMRGIYEQYIIRNTVDEYEERLVTEATNFSNEVKAFLELSR